MNEKILVLVSIAVLIIGVLLLAKWAYARSVENITPEKAYALIQKNIHNPNFVILDVRTPKEFADGYIEDAVNLDFNSETFKGDLDKLSKDKVYVVHCAKGGRSRKALDMMKSLGFREAYNVKGGIIKWKEKGFPVKKDEVQTK